MNKTILITVGVLIIILIVSVWAYLFTFGAPKSGDEILANFGSESSDVVLPQNPDTKVDVGNEGNGGMRHALKQLTTKPVAGAGFTTHTIRYVEQGTGHVYEINLTSGKENLINGTTIPGAREAIFSQDASYVAITTLSGGNRKTILGKVGEGEWKGVALPLGASEITFMNATGTLNYFLKKEGGGTAFSYNVLKEANTELFTIPLRDVHVLFGKETYVYTTPTAFQEGYVYKVVDGALTFVTRGQKGLTAFSHGQGVIITRTLNDELVSTHIADTLQSTQPFVLIPEKCTTSGNRTFCAVPTNNINSGTFPDDWYKGVVSYSDILWEINVGSQEATVLSNFLDESGREIDVLQIGTDVAGERIYFVNKNDNALWMFDTTI